MHRAFEIYEILLDIFVHCRPGLPSRRRASPDLLALARTCRAFKEPALDVLWEELDNLSPLVRCLPEAIETSHDLFEYSLSRPLTQTEWDVLQNYTRRIRSIAVDFKSRLDKKSFMHLPDHPPTSEPLFPNLRYLRCEYTDEATPLLHLPFPSLTSLDLVFGDPSIFKKFLESFPKFSPNIRRLFIRVRSLEGTFVKIEPNYIRRWQDLQTFVCPLINLDTDALAYLSHMPALTRLTFKLSPSLSPSLSPLFFSNLHDLTLHSESLQPISRLLSRARLPALTNLTAFIGSYPSRQELTSFFAGVQTSSACHTIKSLTLDQPVPSMSAVRGQVPLLDLEDLRPCMAFRNLRCLKLNIEWNVSLTDTELLALASAWPRLEDLVINAYSGWSTLGGITPNGLLQLLRTCRSLRWVALAINTRGYTALPPNESQASLGLTLPPTFYINVLDSVIEANSVTAVAAFFAGIAPCSNFSFSAWRGGKMVKPPGWEASKDRWDNVFRWANRPSAFLNHFMKRQRSSSDNRKLDENIAQN
ncbi:hypothetical protein OG21DRAFT_1488059 [Imleria badia]|nr:hypothetical protein OG21DRAFT_1488059 [Imleria badia]